MTRKISFHTTEVRRVADNAALQQTPEWAAIVSLAKMQRTNALGAFKSEVIEVHQAADKSHYFGRVYRQRKDDFPLEGEDLTDADVPLHIAADRHLRDVAHFAWWDLTRFPEISLPTPMLGLLCIENRTTPTASSLRRAFGVARNNKKELMTQALIHSAALDRLVAEQGYFKKVLFRDSSSDAVKAAKEGNYGEFAKAVSNITMVETTLRPKRYARQPARANEEAIRHLKEMAGRPQLEIIIEFPNGEKVPLEQAVVTFEVQARRSGGNSKAVDATSIWAGMRAKFREHQTSILGVVGRRVPDDQD